MARSVSSVRGVVGDVFINNRDFEIYPTFVAAQTTSGTWINGTATGSSAGASSIGWALAFTAGTASARLDNAEAYEGGSSIKLSTTAVASQVLAYSTPTATIGALQKNAIILKPSTSYTLTYYMKTVLNSGTAGTGATFQFKEYDSAAGVTFTATAASGGITTTTGWTQYSYTWTTNASTRFWRGGPFLKGDDAPGATLVMDAWFDKIRIVENGAARTEVV